MSKSIKVKDHVYDQLEDFRDKRESKSEALERLLAGANKMGELISILQGQVEFEKWKTGALVELGTTKIQKGAG